MIGVSMNLSLNLAKSFKITRKKNHIYVSGFHVN